MKRLIVNFVGGSLYHVPACPACDNYGAPIIGSEPIYADTGDGYGPRIVGYDPVFGDYCTCHYGQALKAEHQARDTQTEPLTPDLAAWADEMQETAHA